MRLTLIACLALGGCALSPGSLAKRDVDMRLTSTKAPRAVASCVYETLNFNNPLESDGDHYWVTRLGTNSLPNSRWDFLPDGNGGTIIELRRNVPIGSGADKVRACL